MRISFLVDKTGPAESGIFADGGGGDGIVKIGTVFTEARYWGPGPFPGEGATKPIHLTVVKILAYGHELDELPSPITGRLFLQGEGAEELAPDVIIFCNE